MPPPPENRRSSSSPLPPGADDRLLAVILTNMFAGVQLVRASDATILYANPRFAEMFGYAPQELEGMPVAILNAPGEQSPGEVAREIIASLESQGFWKGEVENIRKDGTRFWCEANVTAFDHPQYGTVWVTVQLDITDRKRAEVELRRSEERLALVLEATASGAWDWNIATGEVYFSPYWLASLGYDPAHVPHTVAFWEHLVHPADMSRVQDALAKHFAGKTSTYECVNRLRRRDGTWRWNLDRGQVVERSPDGKPVRMVGTDTDLSQQRWTGLREIIPICASCKRIREEGGGWRALELHFTEGSLAQFSHGLCPACERRFSESFALDAPPSGGSSD
ncbi:MAG TPA: PAS domain-containing protein [Gemmatimonadales bacterium]|nr:PAS domain-containing protein [Gemmatimonadales bacterium]